jgi:hypothetical protein
LPTTITIDGRSFDESTELLQPYSKVYCIKQPPPIFLSLQHPVVDVRFIAKTFGRVYGSTALIGVSGRVHFHGDLYFIF